MKHTLAWLNLSLLLIIVNPLPINAQSGWASWYSTEACRYNPDPACPMANGRSLYEQEAKDPYFAASWDENLGTHLRVCRTTNRTIVAAQQTTCVVVEITDRGPARRLYKQGRIIDLSQAAFQAVCGSLSHGLCAVTVEAL